MHCVHRYTRVLDAVQAADHLVAHGMLARVLGDHAAFGGFNPFGGGTYEVAVLDRDDVPRAKELIAAMTPLDEADVDWDDALAPDLTALDPALAPACPTCDATLPMRADIHECPACHEPVDVPELIAETHGPEALAPCYETAAPAIDERALLTARLHCPKCLYSLEGLAIHGHCPECGRPYDKRDIVKSMIQ